MRLQESEMRPFNHPRLVLPCQPGLKSNRPFIFFGLAMAGRGRLSHFSPHCPVSCPKSGRKIRKRAVACPIKTSASINKAVASSNRAAASGEAGAALPDKSISSGKEMTASDMAIPPRLKPALPYLRKRLLQARKSWRQVTPGLFQVTPPFPCR